MSLLALSLTEGREWSSKSPWRVVTVCSERLPHHGRTSRPIVLKSAEVMFKSSCYAYLRELFIIKSFKDVLDFLHGSSRAFVCSF